jgi:hypothetical protein
MRPKHRDQRHRQQAPVFLLLDKGVPILAFEGLGNPNEHKA